MSDIKQRPLPSSQGSPCSNICSLVYYLSPEQRVQCRELCRGNQEQKLADRHDFLLPFAFLSWKFQLGTVEQLAMIRSGTINCSRLMCHRR